MAIHQTIWDSRDRLGRVTIKQNRFAQTLKITPWHMSRVIKTLCEQGRLTKISAKYRNVGVYAVKDPAEFVELPPDAGLGPANAAVEDL